MFRGVLGSASSALRVPSPREEIMQFRLVPSVSRSRLAVASSVWRQGNRKSTIASAASPLSAGGDCGDENATSSPSSSSSSSSSTSPSQPPLPPSNPFYSFMASTPASRAAATSGISLAPAPRPARVCRRCDGCGDVECPSCFGKGSLPRGGYSKKNALNSSKAVGTTWTALQRTMGRTHFDCRGKRVIGGEGGSGSGKKKRKGGQTYYLMVATCDDEIRLWVPGTTLKDRGAWAAGWLAREDLDALRREVNGGGEGKSDHGGVDDSSDESASGGGSENEGKAMPSQGGPRGASCKKCEGTGRVPCPLCSRAGEVIHV